MIGENRGIKKLDGITTKQELEAEFTEWINSDSELKKKYGGLLHAFQTIYEALEPLELAVTYLFEGSLGIEIINFAGNFNSLVELSKQKETEQEVIDSQLERLKRITTNHFKDYHQPIDKKIMSSILKMYAENVPANDQPEILRTINADYNGDFKTYANYVFDKSLFSNEERTMEFLNKYKKRNIKRLKWILLLCLLAA